MINEDKPSRKKVLKKRAAQKDKQPRQEFLEQRTTRKNYSKAEYVGKKTEHRA